MLNQRIAGRAIELAEPLITNLAETGTTRRHDLFVLVGQRDERGRLLVFAEKVFGEEASWEHDYREIARGKGDITARTGLPSREVQLLHPELLRPTDVKYWGSVVSGNVIVAVSGVQPWYDEAIATSILALVRALIQDEITVMAEASPESNRYGGGPN